MIFWYLRWLVALSSAMPLTSAAQSLPRTQLTVVASASDSAVRSQEVRFWTRTLAERSAGAITALARPWNELGMKGADVPRLLDQALYTIATMPLGVLAAEAPLLEGADLAGLAPTIDVHQQLANAYRPILVRHHESKGNVRVLGLWSLQPEVLFCRDELVSLRELKGRKVRTNSPSQGDFVEHFGGASHAMPIAQVPQALAKGTVDCAIGSASLGYGAKWYAGAKHLYPLPLAWGHSLTAANAKSWSALDKPVQTFLADNVRAFEQEAWEATRRDRDAGIACNTAAGAGPRTPFLSLTCPLGAPAKMILARPAAEDDELRREALAKTVLPRWAKRCGEACMQAWNESVGKIANLLAVPN